MEKKYLYLGLFWSLILSNCSDFEHNNNAKDKHEIDKIKKETKNYPLENEISKKGLKKTEQNNKRTKKIINHKSYSQNIFNPLSQYNFPRTSDNLSENNTILPKNMGNKAKNNKSCPLPKLEKFSPVKPVNIQTNKPYMVCSQRQYRCRYIYNFINNAYYNHFFYYKCINCRINPVLSLYEFDYLISNFDKNFIFPDHTQRYRCKQCHSIFNSITLFKNYQNRIVPYQCNICKKPFYEIENLKNHYTLYHTKKNF